MPSPAKQLPLNVEFLSDGLFCMQVLLLCESYHLSYVPVNSSVCGTIFAGGCTISEVTAFAGRTLLTNFENYMHVYWKASPFQ